MSGSRFKTLLAATTAVGFAVASASALESANMVRQIRVESASDATVVSVDATNPPSFTTFKQDRPRRVIVDLAATRLDGAERVVNGDGRLVTRVMARQVGSGANNILRVMVELAREAEYRVMVQGSTLKVLLHPGSGGMLASAGIPMDESPSGRDNPGRDLALAEELSQPGRVDVSAPSDSVPDADKAPQPAGGTSDEGPGATEPPPKPVGVAAGQLQPPGGVEVPATDESASEASAPPAAPRAVAGEKMAAGSTMLAAIHPGANRRDSNDRGGRVVAQESPEQVEPVD
ncbi:MAG: AMIN domain-containing protein, partial [Deltaproteobacteria bacterium]